MWDSLLDYGRLEWQQTLVDLEGKRKEKTPNVAYENVLKESNNVWCVKGLNVTQSNSVVT